MKKYIVLCVLALFLTACGNGKSEETAEYQIYYVNKEGTGLVSAGYDAQESEPEALVEELSMQMNTNPSDTSMHPAKPELVADPGYVLEKGFLYMDYGQEYVTMNAVTEVLYRAAAVKTLTQIDEIEGIYFQVNGAPLSDQKGNVIGMMTADSFVDHTDDNLNALRRESLNLYFSDDSGTALKCEQVEVVYKGSVSLEKLIMEQLLEGPKAEGYKATMPSGCSILNMSVKDGTCYVNMDSGFLNIDAELSEEVVIYSIVNSLTELSTIQKVQFAVNGETKVVLRESLSLEKAFTRNLDLLQKETAE